MYFQAQQLMLDVQDVNQANNSGRNFGGNNQVSFSHKRQAIC